MFINQNMADTTKAHVIELRFVYKQHCSQETINWFQTINFQGRVYYVKNILRHLHSFLWLELVSGKAGERKVKRKIIITTMINKGSVDKSHHCSYIETEITFQSQQ